MGRVWWSLRRLAHLCYRAAVLCFPFAFFDVVDRSDSLIRFTGQEPVTGTTFQRNFQIGGATVEIGHVPALPAAVPTIAAPAIGAGLFWMRGRTGGAVNALLGAAAGLALLSVRLEVASAIAPRFPGAVIRNGAGYWCCVLVAWSGFGLSAAASFSRAPKT